MRSCQHGRLTRMAEKPPRPLPFRNALGQVDEPDYYMMFLNGLAGMIDEAELAGYDADGIAQLQEASEFFWSDYRILQHARAEAAAREAAERTRDEGGATKNP